MTPSEEQIRTTVAQQAGDWFVANQEGSLEYADRVAFVAWLKASPVHVEEYLGVAVIARDLPAAADDPEGSLESLLQEARANEADGVVSLELPRPVRDPPVRRFSGSRGWPLAASAAAAMVLVSASLIWRARDGEFLGLPMTYETAHGQQSALRLPDGSQLHLNTDSAVTVHYSGAERVVDVERGQALFQVVHDGRRRFRVTAGDAQVLAVGTQFDIYRKLDTTVVTVAEGQVVVLARGPTPQTIEGSPAFNTQRVNAGYQLRVDAGVMSAQPIAVDLHQTLAWLQYKIAFERRPLGEVADEFNRYGKIPLEIDDAALRALPVSGVFDANDIDSFARFLTTLDGVIVERAGTRIRVLRMRLEVQEPIATTR